MGQTEHAGGAQGELDAAFEAARKAFADPAEDFLREMYTAQIPPEAVMLGMAAVAGTMCSALVDTLVREGHGGQARRVMLDAFRKGLEISEPPTPPENAGNGNGR